MKRTFFFALFVFFSDCLLAQLTLTFEDQELPLDTFLNDAGIGKDFQFGEICFPNNYSLDFGGYWESGWAISTMRDDSTSGFSNLYSTIAGSGFQSSTYVIGQQNAVIGQKGDASGKVISGLYVTNGTYTFNSIKNGDDFAKKFGGEDGNDPDFFKLEIQKYSNGILQADKIDFFLADFRFDDNSQDYIVEDWTWVDLTALGNVDSLKFTLSSSDTGDFGINTPLFFCLDNLVISNDISTNLPSPLFEKPTLNLFPNPVADVLEIAYNKAAWTGTVQIFDELGRIVLREKINLEKNKIPVFKLETGIYFLYLNDQEGVIATKTFIKE